MLGSSKLASGLVALSVLAVTISPISEAIFHVKKAQQSVTQASEDFRASRDINYDALLRELKKIQVYLEQENAKNN